MTKKYVVHSDGSESRVLTEKELEQENDSFWKVIFFFIGVGGTGFFLYEYTSSYKLTKIIRMFVVVVPSILVGISLSYLHLVIRLFLSLSLILGILAGIVYWLYQIM